MIPNKIYVSTLAKFSLDESAMWRLFVDGFRLTPFSALMSMIGQECKAMFNAKVT